MADDHNKRNKIKVIVYARHRMNLCNQIHLDILKKERTLFFMNQAYNSNLLFPEVKIVEASAGSGKTYELAKRFIQLLMDPRLKQEQIPLRSILAITFTLKATREMRERILEQLKKFALNAFSGTAEKQDFLNAVGLKEEAAGKEAFTIIFSR